MIRSIAVSLAVAALTSLAVAEDLVELEHTLCTNFVTPHTRWARPYAGGPIRVLFFHAIPGTSPGWPGGERAREIIELMQRFDLEATAAYWNNGTWLRQEQGQERILRLLKRRGRPPSPYDVFVFTGVSPDALPAESRQILDEAVQKGAGIVLVGTGADGLVNDSNKLTRPAFLSAGQCYQLGTGRAVTLPTRPEIPYRVGWKVTLDYQMERWGRALLWAAGREPAMTLTVKPGAEHVARADLPGQVATITWTGAPPGTDVQITLRRWDGRKTPIESRACSGPDAEASVCIPALRAGQYHVDAIATSGRGIESWATAPLTVTSPRTVRSVTLDRSWGEIGQDLAGAVNLGGTGKAGEKLRVRLVDRWARSLLRQDTDGTDDSVPFRFRIEPWMPMLLRVEAVLMDQDDEVSSAYSPFRVTKRHRDQFNFVVWERPRSDLGPYVLERLQGMGVTALLYDRAPLLSMAEYEMSHVPSAYRILTAKDDDGIMVFNNYERLGGCWNDQALVDKLVDSVTARFQSSRQHGALVYSLGDEVAVRGSCLSPHCLRAYREYLRQAYGEIAALNACWGTALESFDQVELSEVQKLPAPDAPAWFKEYYEGRRTSERFQYGKRPIRPSEDRNEEIPALQAGNFARWYDRQAYQCYNLVRFCKQFQAGFRKLDPQALTGFEGAGEAAIYLHPQGPMHGGDVDLIIREMNWWGPYPDVANEIIRSVARPGFLRGNWMGYTKDPNRLLRRYWEMVTNNMNMVMWWKWDNVGNWHGLLKPDLGLYPEIKALINDTQVVRDGLGTLLRHCEIQDDRVAMLYAFASTYMAHLDGNPTYGDNSGKKSFFAKEQNAWNAQIHRAGLQAAYVTDRMLRLGEFYGPRYKALILPLALTIGQKEADVIRAFVHNGGTLIADVRPGIYTGHGRPRDGGILDDVFGIRRTGRSDAIAAPLEVAGMLAGRTLAMTSANDVTADPAVQVATGRAMGHAGNVPICIVNGFGAGRAVLLNFPLLGLGAAADGLIKNLLATAGVHRKIRVDRPVEVTRWRNGKIEIVALLGGQDAEARLTLTGPRHVYDLRQRRALGQVQSFTTKLHANRASFFALLPEATGGARLVLPETVARGTLVKARLSVPDAAGKHAVRLGATMPDGLPAPWLNRLVIVDRNATNLDLPWAHNDRPGLWTLEAIDLYTNQASTVRVTVE